MHQFLVNHRATILRFVLVFYLLAVMGLTLVFIATDGNLDALGGPAWLIDGNVDVLKIYLMVVSLCTAVFVLFSNVIFIAGESASRPTPSDGGRARQR